MSIVIRKFSTTYAPDPADPAKLVGTDWVEYGPVGSLDKSTTIDKVSRILDKLQPLGGSQNPAVQMAHVRASIIRPAYEAWKAGKEEPTDGTPLAAWNALSTEEADVFRSRGVKTVEEIASLTDVHVNSFPIPNMRDKIKNAKNFIDAADQTRFANKLAEKDAELERMKIQGAEQADTISDLASKVDRLAEMLATGDDESGDQKPRRGRPPKVHTAKDEEAES